jgi:uncharacterized protein with von Willebrand factor type A (vWA) domain
LTSREGNSGRGVHPLNVSFIAGVGRLDAIRLYRGQKIVSIAESLRGSPLGPPFGPELAVDIYYVFFLPVPILDKDVLAHARSDKDALLRVAILSNLLSNRLLERVKAVTTADATTSIIAAASFVERLSRLIQGESAESGGTRGKSNYQGIASAVEKALRDVERDAEVAKDIKSLVARMGVGTDSTLSYGDDPEAILRLARNTDVERVLRMVLGVRVSPLALSRAMTRYSRGWLSGLEYGDDLERIHYGELALPEELFLAKLANSKLLLYEKQLPAARGPIYVLLDKSGSMIGEKIDWARAVALALLQKSAREGRPFYARFFDSTVYPLLKVGKRRSASDVISVIEYLATIKAGGGTNITNALVTAARDIARNTGRDKVSHVVLITDGEDKIDISEVERSRRDAEMRIISIMIQGHNHYLKRVSDRYMKVRSLNAKSMLEVIEFSEAS